MIAADTYQNAKTATYLSVIIKTIERVFLVYVMFVRLYIMNEQNAQAAKVHKFVPMVYDHRNSQNIYMIPTRYILQK